MLAKFDNYPFVIVFIFLLIVVTMIYLYQHRKYKYLLLFIIILILNELVCAKIRLEAGSKLYILAHKKADKLNRKLIVIGNPTASWKNKLWGPSYGCGDLCIDLAGCECDDNQSERTQQLEVMQKLSNFPSDSIVIFESGTKHIVSGLDKEMKRVAGNHVYSVNLNDTSIIRLLSCLSGAIIL